MCNCKNIEIGSYGNVVSLPPPTWSTKSSIDVDRCLAKEVRELWEMGIVTTGCCCGHNKRQGFISVMPEYESQMLDLGYSVSPHPVGGHFKPKS